MFTQLADHPKAGTFIRPYAAKLSFAVIRNYYPAAGRTYSTQCPFLFHSSTSITISFSVPDSFLIILTFTISPFLL